MADITSPIALDESFNTTETTPRNIADVVANETGDLVTQATAIVTKLQALINAVKPNASDIPLDPITGMNANNVQLGISELKGTLVNIGTWVQLLDTNSAFSTTAKSFNLNDDFTKYKSLIIHYCQYQNVLDCKIVSSSYFNNTSSGARPIFADWNSNHGVSVYKNTTTSVYVTAKSSLDAQYKVRIYGIK